ncbi:hypothetical protein STSO111631_10165 [Stackebrandtia soli]
MKYGSRNDTRPTIIAINMSPSEDQPSAREAMIRTSGRLVPSRVHVTANTTATTPSPIESIVDTFVNSKANSRAVTAPPITAASRSNVTDGTGSPLRLSGIARHPTHAAAATTGSFMTNTAGQPSASAMNPPRGAPTMPPSVMIVMTKPIARPRWSGRTLVDTIGMYTAIVNTPATPCRTRAATSRPKVGAMAAATLMTATPPIDRRKTALRFARSAHCPAEIAMAAIGSEYPRTTQAVAAADTSN